MDSVGWPSTVPGCGAAVRSPFGLAQSSDLAGLDRDACVELVAIQHRVGVLAYPEAKQRMRCVSAARFRHVWDRLQGRLV